MAIRPRRILSSGSEEFVDLCSVIPLMFSDRFETMPISMTSGECRFRICTYEYSLAEISHRLDAQRTSFCGVNAGAKSTAPLEAPASDADLVYEPVDDGWPGHDEPTYKYH